jgi:hypothetical protein
MSHIRKFSSSDASMTQVSDKNKFIAARVDDSVRSKSVREKA